MTWRSTGSGDDRRPGHSSRPTSPPTHTHTTHIHTYTHTRAHTHSAVQFGGLPSACDLRATQSCQELARIAQRPRRAEHTRLCHSPRPSNNCSTRRERRWGHRDKRAREREGQRDRGGERPWKWRRRRRRRRPPVLPAQDTLIVELVLVVQRHCSSAAQPCWRG